MLKYFYLTILAVLFIGTHNFRANAQNVVPTDLKAEVIGTKVDLSWSRSVMGQTIQSNDFEAAFPGEGWTVKTKNNTDYKCTWFKYPTDEVKENLEGWEAMIYNGEASAVVMGDNGYHEGKSYIQDEWLISPVVSGAAFLDFYCYIHPMIREYGKYEDFPDHYYVKVSYDGGSTWEAVWDARYDSSPFEAWQQVSIPLNSSKDAMVAFEAMGNQDETIDESLYFAWAIDDVVFSNSEAASQAARTKMQTKNRVNISAEKSYKEFDTANRTKAATPAKAPQKAMAVNSYNIYLDGNIIASNIKSLQYTDVTMKEAGKHTYKVTYVDAATGKESEGAEVTIEIVELTFNPPTNLRVSYVYDKENDNYTIYVAWDEPEGNRKPSYYNVYRDGEQLAYFYEELVVSQSAVPRGIYTYQVSATYEYPEGDSPMVSKTIAIDSYYPVRDLAYNRDGSDIILTWEAPIADEKQVFESYSVYRGNTCLTDKLTETSYTDKDAPNGVYDYSVIANYASGKKSPRQFLSISIGEPEVYTLPLNEDFEGGMTPANWVVYTGNRTDVKYRWRFDNFFNLSLDGGFSGDFASINSVKSGYYMLECQLRSPQFSTELKDGEKLFVEFDLNYMSNFDKNAGLFCSLDGGSNWYEVGILPSYTSSDLGKGETCKPERVCYELTYFVGSAPMMLCWNYETYQDGHLSIDNVSIYKGNEAGVGDIEIDNTDAKVEYFNLQGIPVENPENGMYIKRQGTKVCKIIK